MAENPLSAREPVNNNQHQNHSGFLTGGYSQPISWTPFVLLGILLSLVVAVVINHESNQLMPYLVTLLAGSAVTIAIFRTPELGGYMLIVSVITNLSDILTDQNLPSINRPLIVITVFSILANYVLNTGKYPRFPRIIRPLWMLLAFYGAIIASTFVAPEKTKSLAILFDITKDILVGATIFLTLNTREKWQKGAWLFIITAAFLGLLGMVKVITGTDSTFFDMARLSIFGQVDSSGTLRYAGPIGESNLWGQILVAILPLALFQLTRISRSGTLSLFLGASVFLIFLAMIYTGSRGAFLALLIVLPLLAIESRANPKQVLVGVMLFASLLTILPSNYTSRLQSLGLLFGSEKQDTVAEDDSYAGRRVAMLAGLAMLGDNPFLGVGIGNYGVNYWQYAGTLEFTSGGYSTGSLTTDKRAHSLYVEILSETGLVGFTTFLALFASIFSGLLRVRDKRNSHVFDSDWRRWIVSLAVSILTFLIGGFFLHGLLFRFIWVLIGTAFAGIAISEETLTQFSGTRRRSAQ